MRHHAVRRSALLLTALIVLGAGVFAWLVGAERTGAPEATPAAAGGSSAAALFVRHCGSCHAAGDLTPAFAALDDAGRLEMARFLDTHGSASAAEDQRIAEYLATRR
jgi:hypothetical protein